MVAAGELGGPCATCRPSTCCDWLTIATENTGSETGSVAHRPGPLRRRGCGSRHRNACLSSPQLRLRPPLDSVLADLTSFVPGRRLDDSVEVLLRFVGGAKGMLWASQIAVGHENGLSLRIYGDKGGLEWAQENPNQLWFARFGEPKQLLTKNGHGAGAANRRASRIPAGHPEGYLEAFAILYREAADAILASEANAPPDPTLLFPTVDDGVRGIAFVTACISSSTNGEVWTCVDHV